MSRTINPRQQYEKDGKPIVNGKAYYGVANQDPKLNPIIIYSDSFLTVPITNPQLLDSQGRTSLPVYIEEDEYSFLIEDSLGDQQLLEPALEPLNVIGLVTADIDLNGFHHINVGDPTANNQYATLGQSNEFYGQAVIAKFPESIPDAIVADLPIPLDALKNGQQIKVLLTHGANTIVNPTFQLNPFPAKTISREGNNVLFIGDTGGLDNYIELAFNLNTDKWQLINTIIVPNAVLDDMAEETIKGRDIGTGDGKPIDLTAAQVKSIVFITPPFNTFIFTSNDTYVPTAGTTKLEFEVIGAGGGGGGAEATGPTTMSASTGGSSGGYIFKTTTTIDATYALIVGTGGAGGSAGVNNGNNGGLSSVISASINLSAGGGLGGISGSADTVGLFVVSGVAGASTVTGGDINANGSASTNSDQHMSSISGGGFYNAALAAAFLAAGENNSTNGSGGAGVHNSGLNASARAGGNGGGGIIIVKEYLF